MALRRLHAGGPAALRPRPARALAAAVALLGFAVAQGARAPNAVERELAWRGEDARVLAGWFGLDPGGDGSRTLRLGRGAAWAVYLLKQDTPTPLSNDNEGSPPRDNVVVYRAGPEPSLTIGPYWLDLGTRSPQNEPGRLMFPSPQLPDQPDGDDVWSALARRLLREPGYRAAEWHQMQRCLGTAPELCLDLYADRDAEGAPSGHSVSISARP